MILEIPIVSLILALAFFVFVFLELKTKFHGVFIIIGLVLNVLAIFFLFYYGTPMETALLFLLGEILLFITIAGRRDKNAV